MIRKLTKKEMSDFIKECDICGKAAAVFTCRMCGRHVCENCFDSRLQVCTICAKGRQL
ncbi:hypothetical protein KY311_01525 [Candidatus Woesearchaeota archaeon]|nr:hypothetical protein [Candidatus Woesearchaeota archaeon]MBW3017253.1 hypothetical protein [Candidatus Woesearchaeota archaeon]